MGFYSKLSADYEGYLIRLIFGAKVEKDPLQVCVDTAYLDFNRTLRGISEVQNRTKLHTDAVNVLMESLAELAKMLKTPAGQSAFDDWHKEVCSGVVSVYEGSFKVHSGQAQKWLNMALKYIYTLGEERVPGFGGAYPFCHAPLDKIVVDGLTAHGLPRLSRVWSQIDYDEYFDRQMWIRNKFNLVSMDVEFLLWLGKPISMEHLRRAEHPAAVA